MFTLLYPPLFYFKICKITIFIALIFSPLKLISLQNLNFVSRKRSTGSPKVLCDKISFAYIFCLLVLNPQNFRDYRILKIIWSATYFLKFYFGFRNLWYFLKIRNIILIFIIVQNRTLNSATTWIVQNCTLIQIKPPFLIWGLLNFISRKKKENFKFRSIYSFI